MIVGSLRVPGSITSETEADQHLQTAPDKGGVAYQASSPDEVALVQWTQEVGLALARRDLSSMQLRGPDGRLLNYAILQIFPFTSETKRMGIIVKVRRCFVCGENSFFRGDFGVSLGVIIIIRQTASKQQCNVKN